MTEFQQLEHIRDSDILGKIVQITSVCCQETCNMDESNQCIIVMNTQINSLLKKVNTGTGTH